MATDSSHHILFLIIFTMEKLYFRAFLRHWIFPLESDIFAVANVCHYSDNRIHL